MAEAYVNDMKTRLQEDMVDYAMIVANGGTCYAMYHCDDDDDINVEEGKKMVDLMKDKTPAYTEGLRCFGKKFMCLGGEDNEIKASCKPTKGKNQEQQFLYGKLTEKGTYMVLSVVNNPNKCNQNKCINAVSNQADHLSKSGM